MPATPARTIGERTPEQRKRSGTPTVSAQVTADAARMDGNVPASAGCHHVLSRKEVIQPQVLLQLPCYDFTPIINHTVGACLPCGLAGRLLVQPTFVI